MGQDSEELTVSADASELDLTNAHLQSLDDVPLPDTLAVSVGTIEPLIVTLLLT